MQVAAIQYYDSSETLLWNLQSSATYDYNSLSVSIWAMQGLGASDGDIENGFQLALDNIIGSSDDRSYAPNVILTLGDGGGASNGISNLNDMIQQNDRFDCI